MFETLPNPSLEMLLIAGRAVMLIGAFWVFALAFARWRRASDQSSALLQARLEQTFTEIRSLHETVVVMGARLEALSERSDVETRLAPAGVAASQRGYDVAARLARNGAEVGELVASCGVTRHEAELLVRLHRAASQLDASAHGAATRTAHGARPEPVQASAPATVRKRGSLLSVVG